MQMNRKNNKSETTTRNNDRTQDKAEQDTEYNNSSEVTNPNPSTATPAVPVEMPER